MISYLFAYEGTFACPRRTLATQCTSRTSRVPAGPFMISYPFADEGTFACPRGTLVSVFSVFSVFTAFTAFTAAAVPALALVTTTPHWNWAFPGRTLIAFLELSGTNGTLFFNRWRSFRCLLSDHLIQISFIDGHFSKLNAHRRFPIFLALRQ